MTFDLDILRELVRENGKVVRVVVAGTRGSVPRETGAAMAVWPGGQIGTIGGGSLEHAAAERALSALASGDWLETFSLGPDMGQCCGGAVTLAAEVFDEARLGGIKPPYFLRRLRGPDEPPLQIRRIMNAHRNSGLPAETRFADGWLIEPIQPSRRPLWLFGAGHVGRAVVEVLAPLPDFAITWIDTDAGRFPASIPPGVAPALSKNPADLVQHAPVDAEHLIFTFSHAFDLEICHRLLGRGFRSAGLIGSKTKWARFRKRLSELGHGHSQIARIDCPIGRPELGKHPQAIAVGVAADLLSKNQLAQQAGNRVG